MKKQLISYAIASAFFSFNATAADSYQTFFDAGYTAVDREYEQQDSSFNSNMDAWRLSAAYYFSPRPTMGPNKEFQFINQQSFIRGSVLSGDDGDAQGIQGEYLFNNWVISGDASFSDFNDTATIGLGYFFTKDFKVSVYNTSYDSASGLFDSDKSHFSFKAEYVVPLKNNDYLGFALDTDEDFNYSTVNSKYLTQVGSEQYISVNVSATVYGDELSDNDDAISTRAEFYFTKRTSLYAGVQLRGDADGYSVGATHFFNDNSSLSVGYADYDVSMESAAVDNSQNTKQWNISYRYQY